MQEEIVWQLRNIDENLVFHTALSWLALPFIPVQSLKGAQAYPASCVGPNLGVILGPSLCSTHIPSISKFSVPFPECTQAQPLSHSLYHPHLDGRGHLSTMFPLLPFLCPHLFHSEQQNGLLNASLFYPPPCSWPPLPLAQVLKSFMILASFKTSLILYFIYIIFYLFRYIFKLTQLKKLSCTTRVSPGCIVIFKKPWKINSILFSKVKNYLCRLT